MRFLRVFSKDEAKYIPFEPPSNTRIDLSVLSKLDFTKTLLMYKEIPFALRFGEAEIVFKSGNNFYSRGVGARFEAVEWHFIDKNFSKPECIEYTIIELDPEIIPHSIMDVLFFHELREMYYREKLKNPRKIAHRKARKDERNYANNFLSIAEKQIYEKFSKEFKPAVKKIFDGEDGVVTEIPGCNPGI